MLQIAPHVKEAIETLKPVVALESTIITHGMPYPANLHTALEVEQVIKEAGAVPATIGVINGDIKVGLSEEEITYLSQAKDLHKISLKDCQWQQPRSFLVAPLFLPPCSRRTKLA